MDPIRQIAGENLVRVESDYDDIHPCFLISSLTARELQSLLWIPVGEINEDVTTVTQRVESPWQRRLRRQTAADPYSELPVIAPLVVSGRDAWVHHDSQIEVFESATVLDGAMRLQWLTQFNANAVVPLLLILGLDPVKEWRIRQTLESQATAEIEVRERFDTDTERLQVGESPVLATIISEPFAARTSFSYVPVILLRRDAEPVNEHLIVSARSLFNPLEEIIRSRGKLKGTQIEVRKESSARSAAYQVTVLGYSET